MERMQATARDNVSRLFLHRALPDVRRGMAATRQQHDGQRDLFLARGIPVRRAWSTASCRRSRARPAAGQRIRIWSMPCSTGEEPYSIAIHLLENWKRVDDFDIEILASDIDTARARAGAARAFTASARCNGSAGALRAKYFTTLGDDQFQHPRGAARLHRFRCRQHRRSRRHDALPGDRRHLLPQSPDLFRRRLAARSRCELLYECLNPGGFVCLGHSESMSRISSLFKPRKFADTDRLPEGQERNMKKVLVVEDSATARAFYRSTLEGAGFSVDEAANGLEGLERAMLDHYDLAIVDINMPKMDGYAMTRELRGNPESARPSRGDGDDGIGRAGRGQGVRLRRQLLHRQARRSRRPHAHGAPAHGVAAMKTLLERFIPEARDLIESSSTGLLKLERTPGDQDAVNEVFRAVHTLKGSSGLFPVPALTRLVHVAEDLLGAVRSDELAIDAELIDALLAALDQVDKWVDCLEAQIRCFPKTPTASPTPWSRDCGASAAASRAAPRPSPICTRARTLAKRSRSFPRPNAWTPTCGRRRARRCFSSTTRHRTIASSAAPIRWCWLWRRRSCSRSPSPRRRRSRPPNMTPTSAICAFRILAAALRDRDRASFSL